MKKNKREPLLSKMQGEIKTSACFCQFGIHPRWDIIIYIF